MVKRVNLEEILLSNNVVDEIEDNLDTILDYIPELYFEIGFDQKHPHHHLDVWNHTLYALSLSDIDSDIRMALLFHDIGKPFSYQEGDIRHFKGHAKKSSEIAKVILKRLNYKDEKINYICSLIENHDSPITLDLINRDIEFAKALYKIQYCDALAHHPDKLEIRKQYLKNTKEKILALRI